MKHRLSWVLPDTLFLIFMWPVVSIIHISSDFHYSLSPPCCFIFFIAFVVEIVYTCLWSLSLLSRTQTAQER